MNLTKKFRDKPIINMINDEDEEDIPLNRVLKWKEKKNENEVEALNIIEGIDYNQPH